MTGMTPEKKLLDLVRQAQGKLRLKRDLKIFTKVNLILVALIAAVLVIFLVDVFTFNYKVPELSVDLAATPDIEEDADRYDEYIDVATDEKPSISKEEVVKDMGLLGIIRGHKDQAVIEDKKEKKTYFLYRGDSFGEFTLFDIKDSAVILEYKGERVELKI